MNFKKFEFDPAIDSKDTYYEMKCLNCGAESRIPDFVYEEEADFEKEPCFCCFECNKYALYLKSITLRKLEARK